jgi:hypothetical protein
MNMHPTPNAESKKVEHIILDSNQEFHFQNVVQSLCDTTKSVQSFQITESFFTGGAASSVAANSSSSSSSNARQLKSLLQTVGRHEGLQVFRLSGSSNPLVAAHPIAGQVLGLAIASHLQILQVNSGLTLDNPHDVQVLANALHNHPCLQRVSFQNFCLAIREPQIPQSTTQTNIIGHFLQPPEPLLPFLEPILRAVATISSLLSLELVCCSSSSNTNTAQSTAVVAKIKPYLSVDSLHTLLQCLAPTLQVLHLSNLRLQDDHLVAIARELSTSSTATTNTTTSASPQKTALKELVLNDNPTTAVGLDACLLLLETLPCLTRMEVFQASSDKLSDTSFEIALGLLKANHVLQTLHLNVSSYSQWQRLEYYLQLNQAGRVILIKPTATPQELIQVLSRVSDNVGLVLYCLQESQSLFSCGLGSDIDVTAPDAQTCGKGRPWWIRQDSEDTMDSSSSTCISDPEGQGRVTVDDRSTLTIAERRQRRQQQPQQPQVATVGSRENTNDARRNNAKPFFVPTAIKERNDTPMLNDSEMQDDDDDDDDDDDEDDELISLKSEEEQDVPVHEEEEEDVIYELSMHETIASSTYLEQSWHSDFTFEECSNSEQSIGELDDGGVVLEAVPFPNGDLDSSAASLVGILDPLRLEKKETDEALQQVHPNTNNEEGMRYSILRLFESAEQFLHDELETVHTPVVASKKESFREEDDDDLREELDGLESAEQLLHEALESVDARSLDLPEIEREELDASTADQKGESARTEPNKSEPAAALKEESPKHLLSSFWEESKPRQMQEKETPVMISGAKSVPEHKEQPQKRGFFRGVLGESSNNKHQTVEEQKTITEPEDKDEPIQKRGFFGNMFAGKADELEKEKKRQQELIKQQLKAMEMENEINEMESEKVRLERLVIATLKQKQRQEMEAKGSAVPLQKESDVESIVKEILEEEVVEEEDVDEESIEEVVEDFVTLERMGRVRRFLEIDKISEGSDSSLVLKEPLVLAPENPEERVDSLGAEQGLIVDLKKPSENKERPVQAAEADKARCGTKEEERLAEAKSAEEARIGEEKTKESRLKTEEVVRSAEEKAIAEGARIAEENRLTAGHTRLKAEEEARIVEEERLTGEEISGEVLITKETRLTEKALLKAAEEARVVEEKRSAEDKIAEEARIVEEKRLAKEERSKAKELARFVEENRLTERIAKKTRMAEKKRPAEETRLKVEEEDRIAEKKRPAEMQIDEDNGDAGDDEAHPELPEENQMEVLSTRHKEDEHSEESPVKDPTCTPLESLDSFHEKSVDPYKEGQEVPEAGPHQEGDTTMDEHTSVNNFFGSLGKEKKATGSPEKETKQEEPAIKDESRRAFPGEESTSNDSKSTQVANAPIDTDESMTVATKSDHEPMFQESTADKNAQVENKTEEDKSTEPEIESDAVDESELASEKRGPGAQTLAKATEGTRTDQMSGVEAPHIPPPGKTDVWMNELKHPGTLAFLGVVQDSLDRFGDSDYSVYVYRDIKRKLTTSRFIVSLLYHAKASWQEASKQERIDYIGQCFKAEKLKRAETKNISPLQESDMFFDVLDHPGRLKAEEEQRLGENKAAEEARLKADEEMRILDEQKLPDDKVVEEARLKAEEETRTAKEARLKDEEKTTILKVQILAEKKAAEEARLKAKTEIRTAGEARLKAKEEVEQILFEEEQRLAKMKAAEELRLKAGEEEKILEEQRLTEENALEETRRKADVEARLKADDTHKVSTANSRSDKWPGSRSGASSNRPWKVKAVLEANKVKKGTAALEENVGEGLDASHDSSPGGRKMQSSTAEPTIYDKSANHEEEESSSIDDSGLMSFNEAKGSYEAKLSTLKAELKSVKEHHELESMTSREIQQLAYKGVSSSEPAVDPTLGAKGVVSKTENPKSPPLQDKPKASMDSDIPGDWLEARLRANMEGRLRYNKKRGRVLALLRKVESISA